MDKRPKILLADDDPDLLDMYREILAQLPSRPEIHTAASGARAIAMLEAEPFQLLICDLKMPKMDGLQVLAIVRRKYPQLRTVAMTAEVDEQFRSRAYALGVDLFWYKPATEQETKMFLECIESLLGRETEGGFRGMQSKSLMDIIQLECISQSSSVLRITNGALTGKIWIQGGELVDAEATDLRGEAAFQKILSWKAGNFEMLPAEPSRPRTIFKSYNALLLESAQAMDESLRRGDGRRAPRCRCFPAGAVVAACRSRVCAGDEIRPERVPGRARIGEPRAHGRVGAAEPGAIPVAGGPPRRGPARTDRGLWPAASRRAGLPETRPSFVSAGNIRWRRSRSGR